MDNKKFIISGGIGIIGIIGGIGLIVDQIRTHSYDDSGYNKKGYDRDGYDRDGYDKHGYNKKGYDRDGYDKHGYDKNGYDRDGYDEDDYDKNGYDRDGYDRDGYDKHGYNKKGYDRDGYNEDNRNRAGYTNTELKEFIKQLDCLLKKANEEYEIEEYDDSVVHCRKILESIYYYYVKYFFDIDADYELSLCNCIDKCFDNEVITYDEANKLHQARKHANNGIHTIDLVSKKEAYFTLKTTKEEFEKLKKETLRNRVKCCDITLW